MIRPRRYTTDAAEGGLRGWTRRVTTLRLAHRSEGLAETMLWGDLRREAELLRILTVLLVRTLLLLVLTLLLVRTLVLVILTLRLTVLVQRRLGKTEHLLRSWKSTRLGSHRIGDLRRRRARLRTSIGRRIRLVSTLPKVSRRIATRAAMLVTVRVTLAAPWPLAPRSGRRLRVTN